MGQCDRGTSSVLKRMRSPSLRFLCSLFHFERIVKVGKYSLHHLRHIMSASVWAILHLITDIKISDPVISDHCAVHCSLQVQKPHFAKKRINYRKLSSVDTDSFCEDILSSPLLQDQATELTALVDQYDNVLRSLLDLHAPLKQRTVTLRPHAPWYKPEVAVQKNIRRRLERKWRSTRLQYDREQYVHQCYVVNNLIDSLKSTYYNDIINDHSSDQKILFKTVSKILQKTPDKRYPPSPDSTALANSFADFFTSKIDKIHHGLVERKACVGSSLPDMTVCGVELCNFAEVTQEELKMFSKKPLSKSCELDPLPATVLKGCFTVLLPTITKIVNLSLSTGTMPDTLKVAILSPILKKSDADFELFQNFRPISNLKVVSKLVEKAAAIQLIDHVMSHHLDEVLQSAYKNFHSTETALVKVQNDILCAMDNNESVILLLLDLSAAFDTVDHSILLSRLQDRFGVKGTVLAWFKSYLTSRKQYVQVNDCNSTQRSLERGVPQGSVLGPLLYLLYTSPIADIIKLHKLRYHLYADDTQLYISFKTDCSYDLSLAKHRVEYCVNDLDCWMVNNGLKLNQEKTELVLITSQFRSRPTLEFIQVGDEKILPKSSARNLGVTIDHCFNLTEHVKKICVSCHYHLRNIAKIRKYLSENTSEILVHAFISSKLDNCNSLLYGLPKHLLNKLRLVQNTAARIVTLTKRFDHITPIMFQLHWLPLNYRIHFKILLLVFKCLNGLAPTYLSDLLHYHNSPRLLRSSFQNLLAVPKSRLKTYGDRAFSVVAPRLWNKLPLELRSVTSVDQFKTQLKTYLFKLAYDV